MGITYSAGVGTTITSAAKNGTLGTQPSPQSNIIVFDTNIATNNGQLTASPSFAGRLVIIRLNQPDEETRYISSVAADGVTCTVTEDWVSPPASGDTYHISYLIKDAASISGVSLLTKRNNDYACAREFTVGNGTAFAFFALLDGASMELGNNNNILGSPYAGDFNVRSFARFQNGYLLGGLPVSGGYMIATSTGTGTYLVFGVQEGAQVNLFDYFMSSVYENNLLYFTRDTAPYSSPDTGFVNFNGVKFFRTSNVGAWQSRNFTIKDTIVEDLPQLTIPPTSTNRRTLQFNNNVPTIESLTVIGNAGLRVGFTGSTLIEVRNVTFVNTSGFIDFWIGNMDINLIDLVGFEPNLFGQYAEYEEITIGVYMYLRTGTVREQYSLKIKTTLPGTGISANGRGFVYDASTGLVVDTDTSAAPDYETDAQWTYRDFTDGGVNTAGSPFYYVTDTVEYGPFSAQILHYGYVPQVFTLESRAQFKFNAFMVEDSLQTGTAAAALTAVGSPEPVITRHGTGETDPRPMKFLYINQQITSKRGLAVGDVLYATASSPTPGSPAPTGTVLAIISNNGDLTAAEESNGWVLLGDWNGVEFEEFSNVETQTSPAFQGIIELGNRSPDFAVPNAVYQEYTMEVNANGASLADTYRFIIAALCENPHTRGWTDAVLGWMRDEQPYLLDYDNGNGKFQTQRNAALLEGVFVHNYGAGNVNYFTSDDGTTWVPPSTATVTFTNLQPNTEVRLFRTDTMAELGTGTENSGTTVDVTYPVDIESPLLTAYAVLFSITYEPVYIQGIELDGTNQTIPIVQRFDRNYNNP